MFVTIYELLGMVKDDKAPKKIKYNGIIWKYDGEYYYSENNVFLEEYCNLTDSLNDEVEILEEEKKIPEKLKIEQDTPSSNYYIRNENGTKCGLTKHSKMIAKTLNQVIDYLKSKGE